MMNYTLEIGGVYYATPSIQGDKRRIAAVIGREGNSVQLAFLDELAVGKMEAIHGREVARVATERGEYTISAAVMARAADAAIVRDILEGERKLKKI